MANAHWCVYPWGKCETPDKDARHGAHMAIYIDPNADETLYASVSMEACK